MPQSIRRRFEAYQSADLTWREGQTGKAALISWQDQHLYDLGADVDGRRFLEISELMLTGRYYPPETIECFGLWMDEGREIRPGDRILQRIRLFPFSPWPALWGMTEVFVAERHEATCFFGYLTTRRHFGRGIWQAKLQRLDDSLQLEVSAISGPHSWLFWIGLPIGRALQQRAWKRAAEAFRQVP